MAYEPYIPMTEEEIAEANRRYEEKQAKEKAEHEALLDRLAYEKYDEIEKQLDDIDPNDIKARYKKTILLILRKISELELRCEGLASSVEYVSGFHRKLGSSI